MTQYRYRPMKYFFACLLFLTNPCFSWSLHAQTKTATINKIWMDHTGTGNDEITIHIDCDIENRQGKQTHIDVFFDDPNGNTYTLPKNSGYSKYCNSDGNVLLHKIVTPRYNSSNFSDIKLSLPSYILSMAKNKGKYHDTKPQSYSVWVGIWDPDSRSYISYGKNHGFYVCRQRTVCPMGFRCGICFGTGKVGGSIYGVVCDACHGTGICPMCEGSGFVYHTYTAANKNQLEQIIYGATYSGTPAAGTAPNSYYSTTTTPSTYSNSSSSNSRRVCPGCNGTGKGMREIIHGTDYTGGKVTYHCSECSLTTPHSHRTPICRVCYGKGYVE